ncbi:hypothetical protein GGX14DRAFT_542775 [Mycena pura]|uniref:Uncharacterized protein n=1 Tax=Mycena pura TaxID=153505 RepID=A0AAD6YCM1_9AGAR|nr:hypothetical protein GGX14DRAFT_542775 [Mycena pura]
MHPGKPLPQPTLYAHKPPEPSKFRPWDSPSPRWRVRCPHPSSFFCPQLTTGRALGRVLRSGKEFSPFGLFQSPPPSTESLQATILTDFDVSAALQEQLSVPEQDKPTPSVVEYSASEKGRVRPWIEPPSPPMVGFTTVMFADIQEETVLQVDFSSDEEDNAVGIYPLKLKAPDV